MRLRVYLVAALALTFVQPAYAAWQSYENETWGYSVQFPGEPSEGTGIYRSDLAFAAPTHYTRLVDGDATYTVMVVETGRPEHFFAAPETDRARQFLMRYAAGR